MKKINMLKSFILLCAGLYMCGNVNGQTRVSGTMYSPSDTICYRWLNLSDGTKCKDQVMVYAPGGKFSFDLPDKESVYVIMLVPLFPVGQSNEEYQAMYSKTMSSLLMLYAFPGEQVQVEGNKFISPTYMRRDEMKPVLDGYRAKAKQFDMEGRQDSANVYKAKVSSTILDYIRQHPKDPFSAFLIAQEIPDADARNAYNLLDQSIRDGGIGKYALTAVEKKEKKVLTYAKIKELQASEKDWSEASEKVYTDAAKKRLEAGDAFPALTFRDIKDKSFSMNDLKGKYVYIDVWATWCGPCINELPHLKKLEESFKDKNIAFLSVSVDQNRLAWEEMVTKDKLGGIQVYAGGAKNAFSKFFGIFGIPRFILLDRDGKVLNADMSRPSNPETDKALRALEGI